MKDFLNILQQLNNNKALPILIPNTLHLGKINKLFFRIRISNLKCLWILPFKLFSVKKFFLTRLLLSTTNFWIDTMIFWLKKPLISSLCNPNSYSFNQRMMQWGPLIKELLNLKRSLMLRVRNCRVLKRKLRKTRISWSLRRWLTKEPSSNCHKLCRHFKIVREPSSKETISWCKIMLNSQINLKKSKTWTSDLRQRKDTCLIVKTTNGSNPKGI